MTETTLIAPQGVVYHQHAKIKNNIRRSQKLYKEYVQSLKAAKRIPESLYTKRKRACKEFMKLEAPVAAPQTFGADARLAPSVSPRYNPRDILVELVKDLEAVSDVKHNFIMRDVAKLGEKRKCKKTQYFHDLKF